MFRLWEETRVATEKRTQNRPTPDRKDFGPTRIQTIELSCCEAILLTTKNLLNSSSTQVFRKHFTVEEDICNYFAGSKSVSHLTLRICGLFTLLKPRSRVSDAFKYIITSPLIANFIFSFPLFCLQRLLLCSAVVGLDVKPGLICCIPRLACWNITDKSNMVIIDVGRENPVFEERAGVSLVNVIGIHCLAQRHLKKKTTAPRWFLFIYFLKLRSRSIASVCSAARRLNTGFCWFGATVRGNTAANVSVNVALLPFHYLLLCFSVSMTFSLWAPG